MGETLSLDQIREIEIPDFNLSGGLNKVEANRLLESFNKVTQAYSHFDYRAREKESKYIEILQALVKNASNKSEKEAYQRALDMFRAVYLLREKHPYRCR